MSDTKGKYSYNFELSIGYGNAKRKSTWSALDDYEQEDWDNMSDEEREEILIGASQAWADEYIEISFDAE